MHAFDVLSDPVRRRALEIISQSERASGDIVKVVEAEFGISQSAVSQHLRILRDSGFASVRKDGARRCYAINPAAFEEVENWLGQCTVWSLGVVVVPPSFDNDLGLPQ